MRRPLECTDAMEPLDAAKLYAVTEADAKTIRLPAGAMLDNIVLKICWGRIEHQMGDERQ